MRTIIGSGIILDKRDYKEADIKVLLSTDRYGHNFAVAPNGKKSKRRFVGGLNTFSLIEFSATRRSELIVLDETTLLDEYEVAFLNLESFAVASALVDISAKLFTINNPDETAFYNLRFALEHLSEKKDLHILFNFMKASMVEVGEMPEFQCCAMCHSEIKGNRILFNYYRGGVLCSDCLRKDSRGENISQNLYRLMLADELEMSHLSDNIVRQGIFLLERYLRFKLNIIFRSFSFL